MLFFIFCGDNLELRMMGNFKLFIGRMYEPLKVGHHSIRFVGEPPLLLLVAVLLIILVSPFNCRFNPLWQRFIKKSMLKASI